MSKPLRIDHLDYSDWSRKLEVIDHLHEFGVGDDISLPYTSSVCKHIRTMKYLGNGKVGSYKQAFGAFPKVLSTIQRTHDRD